MASAITTAATTLEGQLLEIVESIAVVQSDATKNPDGITTVTAYTRNMNTGAITVTLAIPTEDSLSTGNINVSAATVYSD